MITIKGQTCKSIILDDLSKSKSNIIYVYNKEQLMLESYYVSSNDFTIQQLIDSVKMDMINNYNNENEPTYLIIYTNNTETEVKPIKKFLKEMEDNGFCRIGIVMCKE